MFSFFAQRYPLRRYSARVKKNSLTKIQNSEVFLLYRFRSAPTPTKGILVRDFKRKRLRSNVDWRLKD
jgi:hypothetical protein